MAKRKFNINKPPEQVVITKSGYIQIKFNTDFVPKHIQRYANAQIFVDSEVLRRSEPYIPLLTGTLRNTGVLGTDTGSGLVQWIAPYAYYQYYSKRKPGSVTGPLRGPFWFERMKAQWKDVIVTGARIIGGGGKL